MPNSFASKGFLSSDIDAFKSSIKKQYSEEFDKASALSERAHQQLLSLPMEEQTACILAAIVFTERTIRGCQGAILLCESGLIQEAQVLVRTATETLFAASALVTDDRVYDRMARASDHEDLVQARGMMKSPCSDFTDDHLAALQEVVGRAEENAAKYPIYEAAQAAGLLPMYETFYRGLSALASHATFRSLDRSFEGDGESFTFIMGPSDKQLAFTLGTVCSCLSEAINCLNKILNKANMKD
ncbi:DUF5677 domain-containing protein [Pseudomonas sp. NFIX28]|uniref:DUF5677 domain-containing protein n=1 Tax=Pseudomonas sp. NFIX28 TaxID=1566235 RepID=UPI00089D0E98|nr:DUF5677 domain-containing protein [Pseudomonas sp. NFIX28]SDY29761.1 hypothetical protein SAMN03159453_00140 [Pseudomonas sp. NFIX28]